MIENPTLERLAVAVTESQLKNVDLEELERLLAEAEGALC